MLTLFLLIFAELWTRCLSYITSQKLIHLKKILKNEPENIAVIWAEIAFLW